MIEILSISGSGKVIDRAEADSPESAVFAARVLLREAEERGYASRLLLARFYVDGQMIRETNMVGLR